jgi:hypothetical protein
MIVGGTCERILRSREGLTDKPVSLGKSSTRTRTEDRRVPLDKTRPQLFVWASGHSRIAHDFARRVFGAEYKGEDLCTTYIVAPATRELEIKNSIFDSSYTQRVRAMQSEKANEDIPELCI